MSNFSEVYDAIYTRNTSQLLDLLKCVKPPDCLHIAVQERALDMVVLLLDNGCDVYLNGFDDISYTPLMWACFLSEYDIAKLLLSRGADVNAYDAAHIGNTALREVVDKADIKFVELVLKFGADWKIKGWMGLDARDKAIERYEIYRDIDSLMILEMMPGKI